MRKKASGADNQQERLVGLEHWIRGFVDGEGCFSIGFTVQPDIIDPKRPFGRRRGYATGYQVNHSFVVVQGERSLPSLELIQKFFGLGKIYRNRRHDNHKEDLFKFEVMRRDDLLNVIIPFFRKYPLLTAKNGDFERFATVLEMMSRKEHLTFKGLAEIAFIAQDMNHRKPRKHLIRILRDYTPGTHAISTKRMRA
jgi:hypothetical protein